MKGQKFNSIKSEKELNKALERIEEIFDSKPDTSEFLELEYLSYLVEKYENETSPIGEPDPIEYVKYILENRNISDKRLAEIIGSRSRVTEIFYSRTRKWNLNVIRALHDELGISADILIKAY